MIKTKLIIKEIFVVKVSHKNDCSQFKRRVTCSNFQEPGPISIFISKASEKKKPKKKKKKKKLKKKNHHGG